MRLFAAPPFAAIAGELVAGSPALEAGAFAAERHPNGERSVTLHAPVAGVECVALGTVQPPDQNLASLLLLCDTLRRCGARSVVALLPYLAYARQDRFEAEHSLAAAWVGQLLGASGVTRVVTLDVHSPRVAPLFPVPLESLGSESLLLAALAGRIDRGTTLVAPDGGAIERCERLRRATGRDLPTAHFVKERSKTGVRSHLVGAVTERAVVVDDILDTGATLVACVEGLRAAGVREVAVAVSHGLFTGAAWRRLWDLGVETIVCTDSVGAPATDDPRVKIVGCAPVLRAALAASRAAA